MDLKILGKSAVKTSTSTKTDDLLLGYYSFGPLRGPIDIISKEGSRIVPYYVSADNGWINNNGIDHHFMLPQDGLIYMYVDSGNINYIDATTTKIAAEKQDMGGYISSIYLSSDDTMICTNAYGVTPFMQSYIPPILKIFNFDYAALNANNTEIWSAPTTKSSSWCNFSPDSTMLVYNLFTGSESYLVVVETAGFTEVHREYISDLTDIENTQASEIIYSGWWSRDGSTLIYRTSTELINLRVSDWTVTSKVGTTIGFIKNLICENNYLYVFTSTHLRAYDSSTAALKFEISHGIAGANALDYYANINAAGTLFGTTIRNSTDDLIPYVIFDLTAKSFTYGVGKDLSNYSTITTMPLRLAFIR